ncbi:hypothetical protein EDB89DRAFT_1906029 [Lactarius sanguifluus]|nr:hypothetical protein EDB89DRAFT_1906029 [Lactarius sanguifluus]
MPNGGAQLVCLEREEGNASAMLKGRLARWCEPAKRKGIIEVEVLQRMPEHSRAPPSISNNFRECRRVETGGYAPIMLSTNTNRLSSASNLHTSSSTSSAGCGPGCVWRAPSAARVTKASTQMSSSRLRVVGRAVQTRRDGSVAGSAIKAPKSSLPKYRGGTCQARRRFAHSAGAISGLGEWYDVFEFETSAPMPISLLTTLAAARPCGNNEEVGRGASPAVYVRKGRSNAFFSQASFFGPNPGSCKPHRIGPCDLRRLCPRHVLSKKGGGRRWAGGYTTNDAQNIPESVLFRHGVLVNVVRSTRTGNARICVRMVPPFGEKLGQDDDDAVEQADSRQLSNEILVFRPEQEDERDA